MIIDPSTPPLWSKDNYRVVPIECLHGVIEVKSFLDSTELRHAWTKIAAIKRMPKKALRSNPAFAWTRTVYGKEWSYVPMCGLVFAYEGTDLRTQGPKVPPPSDPRPLPEGAGARIQDRFPSLRAPHSRHFAASPSLRTDE